MNISIIHSEDNIITTIEKIVGKLQNATTSAEILELKDEMSISYDLVKRMIRIQSKKDAHDDVIDKFRQAQGDLSLGMLRADAILSKEYDLAKENGEVATHKKTVVTDCSVTTPTISDLGIDQRRLSEARKFNQFDEANPGKAEEIVKEIIAEGEDPTKTEINKRIIGNQKQNDLKSFSNICPKCGHMF